MSYSCLRVIRLKNDEFLFPYSKRFVALSDTRYHRSQEVKVTENKNQTFKSEQLTNHNIKNIVFLFNN